MVRQSLLIVNSWSSLDSHRWKGKNINFKIWILSSTHIIRIWGKNIETILKQAGICEIQCSIQDLKNRIPISGPITSPFSTCVPFWGKSCHVGQVNILIYLTFPTKTTKKKLPYELTIHDHIWIGCFPSAAVTSHLLFLNVDTKKPKKLWLLSQKKHPCQVLRRNGFWERLWCSSSLDNGFFLERLCEK